MYVKDIKGAQPKVNIKPLQKGYEYDNLQKYYYSSNNHQDN